MLIYKRHETSLDLFKKSVTKYKMLYSLYLYKIYRMHKRISFSDKRVNCQSPGFPINVSIAFSNKDASMHNKPLYFKIRTTYGYFADDTDNDNDITAVYGKNYIYSYHIQRYDSLSHHTYRRLEHYGFGFGFIMRYSYKHIPLHWTIYSIETLYKMTRKTTKTF